MLAHLLIYGFVNSAIVMLIALGFSLTFGISGISNFAHGAFYILSAFITWTVLNYLGLPLPLAILVSVCVTGVIGAVMYWVVLLRVRGVVLSEVTATFGLGIAILEFFRWQGLVGARYHLPSLVSGRVSILGISIDYQRLVIVGVAFALSFLIWILTHQTKIGLAFRGIAQDEETALTVGVESDWTAMISMAFGSALVAVAAIVIVPLGLISVDAGYEVLVTALAVSVVGGLGSTLGTVLASLIIGYSIVITATFINPSWMFVVYLAAIIVVLAIKPSGLLSKARELEDRV